MDGFIFLSLIDFGFYSLIWGICGVLEDRKEQGNNVNRYGDEMKMSVAHNEAETLIRPDNTTVKDIIESVNTSEGQCDGVWRLLYMITVHCDPGS